MDLPSNSLHVLMSKIIDYAGLYPPASLPLEEAIRNFVKYQNDSDVWMLSRFVIPAKRLVELSELAQMISSPDQVLSFSCLGRSGKDSVEFLEYLKLDIADIHKFRDLLGAGVVVDMFETVLPATVLTNPAGALDLINKTTDALNKNGLTVFFEAPPGEGWQAHAEKLIRALRKIKDKHIGFKLRAGGVTSAAFPTLQKVAWAIATTRDAGVPMKATAGLHHPIRHYDAGVDAKMHGFLNVFGAGVLALTHTLSIEEIQNILEDEDPARFVFEDSGFTWKNFHADIEQITHARRDIVSFGSCSFDEPREDLQKIGLM